MKIVQLVPKLLGGDPLLRTARSMADWTSEGGRSTAAICDGWENPHPDADLVLVHYLSPHRDWLRSLRLDTIASSFRLCLVVHDAGAEEFARYALASIVVECGLLNLPGHRTMVAPLHLIGPATTTKVDRYELRHDYGFDDEAVVISSSGPIHEAAEFPFIVDRVLNAGVAKVFVDLATWTSASTSEHELAQLELWVRRFPSTFRFGVRGLSAAERIARLRASDLLWVWSAYPSQVPDLDVLAQYSAGTRMIVPSIPQFVPVANLPNVVVVDHSQDSLVDAIRREAAILPVKRHDCPPSDRNAMLGDVFAFLKSICNCSTVVG